MHSSSNVRHFVGLASLVALFTISTFVVAGCGGNITPTPVATTPTAPTSGGASPSPTPTPAPAPPNVTPQPISGAPATPPAGAPPLCPVSYSSLDVPNAAQTRLQGINLSNTMVGSYDDTKGITHGMIYSNGQFTTVDGPQAVQNTSSGGSNGTTLTAIANIGLIAGSQETVTPGTSGTYAQGFEYQNGKITTFNAPGSNAIPSGINNSGVIVGFGDLVGCCNVSWIRNPDGTFSQFYEKNAMSPAMPEGVNDNGHIAGGGPFLFTPNFTPPPYPNPTTSANGTFTPFTVPGVQASPQGLNNNDQIVGTYSDPNSPSTFFGWMKSGSNYCSLSVPGATQTFAQGLNDAGVIVGYYSDANNKQHGFTAK